MPFVITCKACNYTGPYEGKLCPECGTRYYLNEAEVREILAETHEAKARREMETVVENYRMLADFGVTEAEREYARHLESEGAWDRAAALYRRAAVSGDATGAYRFALCNPELNEAARRFWLCYAAILGCKESYPVAAEALSLSGDERLATYFYRLAADCDDVGAIVTLARRYASGEGCEKNEGHAKWYMDKLTLPPISALRLAYKLRGTVAEEPPAPAHDLYYEFLKALRLDAERFGFLGAERYLAEILMGKGDVDAAMRMARVCFAEAETAEGERQKRSIEAALSALELAATNGCAEAYLMLGEVAHHGKWGVAKDMQRAVKLYVKAAELLSGEAYRILGELHLGDEIGKRNIPLAIRFLEEGAELGSTEAFRRAAELKDQREAIYYEGIGKEKQDPEGAMRDFAVSASMGYAPAEVKLGDCYLRGVATRGVPDRRAAYRRYQKAYEEGVDAAVYPLALCYSRGVGVNFDFRRAAELLRRGLALGEKRCEAELHKLMQRRLKKSIRSMHSQAVSLLYQHKYTEALRLFTALARMDEAVAVYYLGACYEFGIGTSIDRPLAYAMYRRAAELGFTDDRSKRKSIFLKLVK